MGRVVLRVGGRGGKGFGCLDVCVDEARGNMRFKAIEHEKSFEDVRVEARKGNPPRHF